MLKKYEKFTPEGTKDLLFEECRVRCTIENMLSRVFENAGYKKVITPSIEFFDVFNRDSAGLPAENLYKLTDAAGRLLVLRSDSTLPIARIAATRLKNAYMPLRLYYNQSVFRRYPSYSGFSDESFQGGIELIGASGIRADLEILSTAVGVLNNCGVSTYRVEIGHAGFFKAICDTLDCAYETKLAITEMIEAKNYPALGDLLDTLGDSEPVRLIRALPKLFGGINILNTVRKQCTNAQALIYIDYLESVYNKLTALGAGGEINIDLGLVHRSNYYTGIVFRGYIEGSGVAVVTGGRYDALIGEFGKTLSAIGFGVEVDAIARVMLATTKVEKARATDVLVFAHSGCEELAFSHIAKLSEQGLLCENSVFDSLEKTLEYAGQRSIKRVDIIDKNTVQTVDSSKED